MTNRVNTIRISHHIHDTVYLCLTQEYQISEGLNCPTITQYTTKVSNYDSHHTEVRFFGGGISTTGPCITSQPNCQFPWPAKVPLRS